MRKEKPPPLNTAEGVISGLVSLRMYLKDYKTGSLGLKVEREGKSSVYCTRWPTITSTSNCPMYAEDLHSKDRCYSSTAPLSSSISMTQRATLDENFMLHISGSVWPPTS